MKKVFTVILLIFLSLSLFACKQQDGLYPFVSDLRSNAYQGQSGELTVKGGYGFRETPFVNDGKVGNCAYALTLKLVGKETSQASFTASLDFNNQKYSAPFKLNPVTHSLVAVIEIENFDQTEFNLYLTCGDETQTITMRSIVPSQTISYQKALACLEQSQPQLIKAYSDAEGNFNAEIYARIIVKNDKAYWYVGIASGKDNLKALLIDGANGEVLAIREII